jgi:hypothetical protein
VLKLHAILQAKANTGNRYPPIVCFCPKRDARRIAANVAKLPELLARAEVIERRGAMPAFDPKRQSG